MTSIRWERLAPLTGIVAVVLWVIAFVIFESETPGDDPTAQEVLAYFNNEEGRIYAAAWVWGLGVAFFVWFVGSLRARLARAEGEPGRLAPIAFGAGIGLAVMALALVAPSLSGVWAADEKVTAEAALAIWWVPDGFFGMAGFLGIPFAAAVALISFRRGAFPAWHAWLTVILLIGFIAFPIFWIALIFALPIWILITSALMYVQGSREAPREVQPAA